MKLSIALLAASLAFAAGVPTSWTPEFSFEFQTIATVVPSPDGKLVTWTQSRAVMETEKSEVVSQVFLGPADRSRPPVQLTRGEKGASHPSFTPDGRFVCFSSARSGKTNVHRIAVAGGESEQLTDFKGEFGEYRISPDGKWIAFTGFEPPASEEKAKKEKLDFRVIDAAPRNHALYLVPMEASAGAKREQKKAFEPAYHIAGFAWSPDSRSLAFEHWPAPLADNWTKSDISEVAVETGKTTPVAATAASEGQPFYSPDGRFLAFTRTSVPPRWPGDLRIVIAPRQGGEPRVLPATYDQRPNLVGWSRDSSSVLFTEPKRTRNALYAMPVDGPPRAIHEPARGVMGAETSLNSSGTHLGFAFESPDSAPEAFIMDASGAARAQVSRANSDLPKLPLGQTEVVRWKSKDGLDVEGLLTYPAGYEKGRKYPLILNIHGGPAGVFSETFIGRYGIYPLATFASRGYAVLRPNPRGSSGYGVKFRFANVGDWGGRDFEDDQTGVDHVIAMGVADPDRMAVMGWSYGGFMTSWTITQTQRFKAAVVGAAVTNLWSFTGTADIPGFLPDYFGGEPWDKFEAFQQHSPMTFVKNVKTPTLILHGEADVRVPISQGYEYYNALKRQGVTAKMVVYPRTPHGPREPKFMLDIMQRHLDWVDAYVR
jgi:dipeptidyl aminopeptidase/acylaminoacyl peptidase